jgi:hypothetical protein
MLWSKSLGLKLREWKASRSFEYAALNLQTFRCESRLYDASLVHLI